MYGRSKPPNCRPRRVALRLIGRERDGFIGSSLGAPEPRCIAGPIRQIVLRVGESRIRRGVVWIEHNRLAIGGDRTPQSVRVRSIEKLSPQQQLIVGLSVRGAPRGYLG